MKRNKAEARATILYDPTPANTGPVWAWHAAPAWERQAQGLSLWATLELRNTAWIKESQAKEVAYNLGLI